MFEVLLQSETCILYINLSLVMMNNTFFKYLSIANRGRIFSEIVRGLFAAHC